MPGSHPAGSARGHGDLPGDSRQLGPLLTMLTCIVTSNRSAQPGRLSDANSTSLTASMACAVAPDPSVTSAGAVLRTGSGRRATAGE